MNTVTRALKTLALALGAWVALAAAPAAAAPDEIQDGIAVRPMSRLRVLVSEQQLEQQAALQYTGLLRQAQQKNALVPDGHAQVIRLRTIAKRLIPFAARWNPDAANWRWEVNLLASPQVNAFCMPGGRIAFFSGIISKLKLTDDEIAAVMGHEISHALREHGREQQAKSTGTSVGLRLLGAGVAAYAGLDPRLTDYAASTGAKLAALKFSRDDEREADLIGLDLAARAGFDPRAGIALWQKMAQLNQQQPLALLSTHPGGAERITQIEQHLNLLLPLYARAKGTTPDQLPAYRTVALTPPHP